MVHTGAHRHFRRTSIGVMVVVALVIGAFALLNWTLTASAANFVVDSTVDAVDADPGDGVCATSAGDCTLRAATQEANALDGHDTIHVPAGLYILALGSGIVEPPEPPEPTEPIFDCNVAESGDFDGDLDVTCPVTITGDGAGATIIDGGSPGVGAPPEQLALDRLVEIHPTAGNVTISGLTLRGGYHPEAGGAVANSSYGTVRLENVSVLDSVTVNAGGGIYSGEPLALECPEPCAGGASRLELINTTVSGNTAGNEGGGVYVQFGTLTVSGGEISDNLAASGGGVFNAGEVGDSGLPSRSDLSGVTVSGNRARGAGGGIFGDHEGSITLTGVTLSDNTTFDYGGGIAVVSKSELTISGGTISGNIAVGEGGGVSTGVEGAVTIDGVLFSENAAGKTLPSVEVPGEIAEGEGGGGGIFIGGSGPATITNSDFLGNTATNEGGGIVIANNGSVTISDGEVANNVTKAGGGGIENAGRRVSLIRLSIHHNRALLDGGGIEGNGSGDFTISDSSIYANTAENGGGFANQADGVTRVERTMIWNNRAVIGINDDTGLGGGIYGLGDATAHYENVTITANFAQIRGGGLYIDADADVHVDNSTISRNVAPAASGIGDEATDFNLPIKPSESVMFRNTIVAGNLLSPNCNFALGSLGGNLEDGDSCHFRGARDRQNASDAGLDGIADNGGPSMTMVLRPNSFAIDGGISPCPATDARGVSRPQNGRCDIGAFEYQGPFPPPDNEPPDSEYLSGPDQDTEATSAFRFTGIDDVTPPDELLFECRLLESDVTEPPEPVDPTEPLDPEFMWLGCPSPWQVPIVEEGLYRFEVRAIDRAGNVDPTPDVHIFGGVDDIIPPDTFFTGTPASPSAGTTAVFGFSATDNVTPAQWMEFECRIDTGDPEAWLECVSPVSFTNLTSGQHTVQVRAADGNDNIDPTPATYTWTVGEPVSCEEANITLFAEADTWIDESIPQDTFGIDVGLTVRSQDAGQNARALVRFAVPTGLPPECEIQSARLRLYSEGEAGRAIQAVPIANPWTETGVSWLTQPGTTGTAATTTSGSGYREWDVSSQVVGMMAGDLPNHGFLIRDAVEGDAVGAEQSFTSRHIILDPPETQMPQLVLRFDGPETPVPPAPPTPRPETVVCGQVLTESTLVMNDLFDCQFDGLIIGAPNIEVDLNGHTIDGLNFLLTGQEDGLPVGIRNIGHENVRIHNGTVQEFGSAVQLMAGARFNVVEDLLLQSNALAGVELWDADDGRNGNIVRHNTFVSNGESGISLLSGSENSQIVDNVFDGNAGVAIHLVDAHRHRIENNRVSGVPINPALGSDVGVLLEGSSDNVIVGNTLAETGDAGIVLSLGSHRNLIENNVMTATGDAGVAVDDSDGNQIIGNTAHLASDAGVVLNGANDGVVRNNDVRFNPIGVNLGGSSGNVIEANDADFSAGTGIALGSGSLRNDVIGNSATNTAADGISVEGEAVNALGLPDPLLGNLIRGNTANGNLSDGISVAGVGHTIGDNTANSNAGFGIAAAEGNFDDGGNTASGNGEPEQCIGVVCGPGAPAPPPTPDLTAPDTSFISTPPNGHGMLETVAFTFTGTDNVAPPTALRFQCRLDAPPDDPNEIEPPDLEPPEPGDPDIPDPENWVECANPVTYYLLTTGEHVFEVRAIDPFDNVDLTPAVYTWTVIAAPPGPDSTAPNTTIFDGPSDPTTKTTATFRFGGSDNAAEGPFLTYECRRDAAPFAPCTSPVTHTGLSLGEHSFRVRAIDPAGNVDPSPATHLWTIEAAPPDTTAPETTIETGPDLTTISTDAAFTFSGTDPGADDDDEEDVTFACSLDGAAFADCTSPQAYSGLAVGAHTFAVRAIDGAGNADPSPATYTWTITAPPVATTVTCGQVLTQSTRVTNHLVDCPGDGLVIGAPNITVDLDGHTIDGTGLELGAGIRNNGFDSVTITNGVIQEFDFGVLLNPGTAFNIVSGMMLQLNITAGIQLSNADDGANGNTLRFNTAAGNDAGIILTNGTQHAYLHDNTVSGSAGFSIYLFGASGVRLEGNLVTVSSDAAINLEGSSNNLIVGNTVAGASDAAILLQLASNNNRVEENVVTAGDAGVHVLNSNGNELIGNDASANSDVGITLENAHNGVVVGNDLRFNSGGIELSASSGNLIEANDASEGSGTGISLGTLSLNNVVVRNRADANDAQGIAVSDQASAGTGNLIDRNTTNSNIGGGIYVGATGHIIAGNTANFNGSWGIYAALATVAGGNIDGGGNNAIGNVGPLDPFTLLIQECFNVVCDGRPPVASDPIRPETWISEGPDDDDDNTSTSATFRFGGIDNATAVQFECRLDSTDAADFADCTSPKTYTGLSLGTHTFEVRAVDFLGNVDASPAVHTWTIEAEPDDVPPVVTIDSGPDGATLNTSASFAFSANEEDAAFECALDAGAFAACTSPRTYTGLAVGSHSFQVRAIDDDDLVSNTASFTWAITPAPVPTAVTCGRVLTQSTLVTNDLLDCANNGLVIGAHNITVDLNGHTIDGIMQGVGILNNGFDSVVITNGALQEFDYGVQLNPGATLNVVSLLTLQTNEFAGIQLSDADGNTIRNHTLIGNGSGIALIAGTQNAVVRDNTLSTQAREGVVILNSSGNRVEGNEISSSSEDGILLEGSPGNTVVDNILNGNAKAAIAITLFSHNTRVVGNAITGNAGGILVTESNGNELVNNVVTSNAGGIIIELSHGNVVRVNEVRINAGGIELSDSNDNVLAVNNASANSGPGIAVEGVSLGNELVQNIASGNDGEGIYVGNQAPAGGGVLLDRNMANGNGGDGIFVAGGHTVSGNQADFNDGWGIFAEQGAIDAGGNNALGNSEPEQCFGVLCEIGENPSAPNTTLLERPANPSNSRTATFTFTGTDDTTPLIDLGFECRLDNTDPLAWEECELPAIYTVSPGSHTFEVRAVDLAEVVDPTPESYSWVYQPLPPGIPPDTIIEIAPPPATPMLEAIFKFSSNEPDVTFECSMDGEPFVACANEPEMIEAQWFIAEYEFEEEQVGPHTFRVRAVDLDGLADPTPATHNWTILGALATITNGPAFEPGEGPLEPATGGETEETAATFEFHANVADAEFECSLDLAVFVSCVSGVTYTGLAPGEHIFFVMAIDPEGNFAQLEPTEYEWVVLPTEDTVPPDTFITDQPADNSSETTFTFTGTDNVTSPAAMTYECRLDSTLEADFAECLSPFNLLEAFPDFAPGEHTFDVRANDNAEPVDPNSPLDGNVDPTPASYTWTSVADTTPPTVEILTGPDDPTLVEVEAEFTFTGSDDATPDLLLVYQCVVDEGVEGAVFEDCESPYQVQGALPGTHTFQVRTVDLAGNISPPASYTWTVIGPPDTTITAGPDLATTETTATFEFEADQTGSTFACALNGSAFQACSSPLTHTGLGGGGYTLAIQATNSFGLVETDPAIYEWTVDAPADVAPPDTTILTGPDDPTLSTSAIFTFASSEFGSSFECGLVPLDPLAELDFSSCESPIEYSEFLGGTHEFHVRAIDLAGNVDPTPAVYAWTVLGPPLTTIISGPEDDTEETTATFEFVASVPGATFMCALDVPPFVACSSPVTYTDLAVGPHEFVVFSIANGFADTEGDSVEWDVLEPVALQTTITLAPPTTTTSTDATFAFVSSLPDSTFECRLDSTNEADFAVCATPLNLTGLALGTHTLAVRAIHPVDGVEPTPATYTWTVVAPDTTPPQTTITAMPPLTTVITEATFTFTSSETNSTFECSLDGEPFGECVSPLLLDAEIGPHTFAVRAIDLSLNVDLTPASYDWTVELDTTPPDTTITAGPDEGDTIGDTIVAFQFTGSDDGTLALELEFECAFDGEPFGGCDSPHEIVDLTAGEHTFEVRAVDQEGNVDLTPASRTWTIVDVLAPETSLDLGPEDPTEETTATFEFSSDDPTATFACALDSGDFLPCASPHVINDVTVGLHTFQVRAVDPSDNADPEPELYEWTVVSTAAPDTTITSGPASPTLNTLAVFTFASDQPGVLDFECALDGEPFAGCESPHEIEIVAVGPHALQVRAIDAAEKVDPTPAVYEWTVDIQPETTVVSGPPATTSDTSATFTFTTNELGTTFQCSLDGAAFTLCTSPRTYTGLSVGSHTFAVRTIDANGFTDPTPATYAWTVEAPPPPPPPPSCTETTVSANADAWIDQGSPSDNKGSDSTLKVMSKGPSNNLRAFVQFAMPTSMPEGCVVESATLRVYAASAKEGRTIQAVRVTGNWTENGVTWGNQPATAGPAATVASGSSSGYREWNVTAQVQAMYGGGGNRGFLIRDAAENADTEQQYNSREKGSEMPQLVLVFAPAPPETAVETWPDATTIETTAEFTFSSDRAGSTFECSLDGASFTACTSPREYTGLAVGNHEFRVRATGTWGGTDPTPASYAWTIEPPPNTPAGTDVPVEIPLPGGDGSATLTFDQVTDAGDTTVDVITDPPADGQIQLGDTVYDVETTADFTGNVTVCLSYDPADFTEAEPARLYHFDGTTWVDVTTSNDPVAGQVCGVAPSLSPFAVAPPPDTTAPETAITAGPAATTASGSALFTFEASEPNATFACALDGADFAPCTSPHAYTELPVGEKHLLVRATDEAGNSDESPASYDWTIVAPPEPEPEPTPQPTPEPEPEPEPGPADTTAPNTAIDQTPPDGDTTGNANFTFTATEEDATFECALDGGEFAGCASPQPYSGLGIGDHEFRVRATDAAGNTDGSAAVYQWTIDPAPDQTPVPANCGGEVTVTANADAWIDQGSASSNKGSDSILKVMSKSGNNLRALVTFQMPNIPAGCEIDTATLRLYAASYKSGRTIQAIRVNGTWTENGVKWSNQPPTTGTAATTSSGSGYRQWDVTSQVEVMVDSGVNNGFLIRDANENNDHEQQFHAREKGENPPRLVLKFKAADATPPTTTIEDGPDNPTTADSATFTFSGSDNETTASEIEFECRLNSEAFAACESPRDYDGLEPGSHKFEVRAIDEAGNVDATVARYRWTVEEPPDTTAPDTAIGSGPNGSTTSTNASFDFSASEPGSSFQCSLDGGSFGGCSSPAQYSGLGVGNHEFRVRAIDAAGNADESPASYGWTVQPPPDTTAPDTWIDSGPPDGDTTGTASFAVGASEQATFECSLDGGGFQPCGVPAQYSGLGVGFHEFRVRAIDAAGNTDQSPASYGWNVAPPPDTTAPETWIESGPDASTTSTSAAFTFSANEQASFECSLDGGGFAACPAVVEYGGLGVGMHTLAVRAIDGAGNVDGSPATYQWTVEPPEGGGG